MYSHIILIACQIMTRPKFDVMEDCQPIVTMHSFKQISKGSGKWSSVILLLLLNSLRRKLKLLPT